MPNCPRSFYYINFRIDFKLFFKQPTIKLHFNVDSETTTETDKAININLKLNGSENELIMEFAKYLVTWKSSILHDLIKPWNLKEEFWCEKYVITLLPRVMKFFFNFSSKTLILR